MRGNSTYYIIANMNIHPFFVHFPIALLVVYAILEIISLNKRYPSIQWTHIKAVILFFGVIGAYFSVIAGEFAEKSIQDEALKEVVETHAFFATTATVIFTLLAASYIARLRNMTGVISRAANFITQRKISVLLALLGLIAILITGALGAAIVYGPNSDLFVSFIYGLFFK